MKDLVNLPAAAFVSLLVVAGTVVISTPAIASLSFDANGRFIRESNRVDVRFGTADLDIQKIERTSPHLNDVNANKDFRPEFLQKVEANSSGSENGVYNKRLDLAQSKNQ